MDFYDHFTYIDLYRKALSKEFNTSFRDYRHFYQVLMEGNITNPLFSRSHKAQCHNQCASELTWMDCNKPYYKVYPDWIPVFAQTKLDIPSEYLRTPFDAIAIRFPKVIN